MMKSFTNHLNNFVKDQQYLRPINLGSLEVGGKIFIQSNFGKEGETIPVDEQNLTNHCWTRIDNLTGNVLQVY